MSFIVAVFVVALSCSLITVKTLVGYGSFSMPVKIAAALLVAAGWFSPIWVSGVRRSFLGNTEIYNLALYVGYFLFGVAFLLFVFLVARDIFWYILYGFSRLFKSSWEIDPRNVQLLNRSNLVVVVLTLTVSFYAAYEALKIPPVKEINLYSDKIKKEVNAVVLTDLHINRATPVKHVEKVVERVNALKPDVILMVGDIFDDSADSIKPQANALKGLKSVYGTYFAAGNHEFYNGLPEQLKLAGTENMKVVFNSGFAVPELNLFIAGVPDLTSVRYTGILRPDAEKALKGAENGSYRIMLSHTPMYVDSLNSDMVDAQFSGHTHGGQIFPFHIPVKQVNKYLAGLYRINGIDLYVSRGAGYWGPPMRLFAPSEITQVHIKNTARQEAESISAQKIKEMPHAQNAGLGL